MLKSQQQLHVAQSSPKINENTSITIAAKWKIIKNKWQI